MSFDILSNSCPFSILSSFLYLKMFTVSPYSDPMMVKLHSGMSRHVEDPEMLWVMGPVLAVVLIIVIVIAILLFKRYYYFTEQYTHSSSTETAFCLSGHIFFFAVRSRLEFTALPPVRYK